ncbi:MAG: hypothetical protein PHC39_12755 [Proteiniphilum sp.]|nr:hypothetical protein [Proteiniphilum sp.]
MKEIEINNNIIDSHDLMIRYLDGFASPEEKKELLQWLKSSEENRDHFIQIRDLWLACDSAMGHNIEIDIAYEIGRHEPYHPASLYWDSLHRKELVTFFNDMFGTDIA